MRRVPVHSTGILLSPDPRRVLIRPFVSSDPTRISHILDRAFAMTDETVAAEMAFLRSDFGARHLDLEASWSRNARKVQSYFGERHPDRERELFIGALFSGEYAIESAALFNPCMVPHPDQSGLEPGSLRFVMSLRATGEGHVSSIEFRSGVISAAGEIALHPAVYPMVAPLLKENPTYCKSVFVHKLAEMGFDNVWSRKVMDSLDEEFTHAELTRLTETGCWESEECEREARRTVECLHWLAASNYEIQFSRSVDLSQCVIFPVSPNESNGIEDARFVRFSDASGPACYYATYTAYNGRAILPQLVETRDFLNFRILTLNGRAAQNKGMALFPRRVDGQYAMLSRQDDENLFIMFSDNLHFWNEPRPLIGPRAPWEAVKIGNCGSPMETPEGWLVITHGVGAMRRYCIGALLLDLKNPEKVIGYLEDPLLEPAGETREGYVPNVVYSCGALVHGPRLILPYALSDTSSTIASIRLEDLLQRLTRLS